MRDVVRAACIVAVMAAGGAIIVETRARLAAIDAVYRPVATPLPSPLTTAAAPQPGVAPGPLVRLGQAAVGLADAALGVVR